VHRSFSLVDQDAVVRYEVRPALTLDGSIGGKMAVDSMSFAI
jgi:hypothetical protein